MLPFIAGLTGDAFYNPAKMTDGFMIAALASAGLAALGGILAWFTISSDVLHAEPEPGGSLPTEVLDEFSGASLGPPMRPGREAECQPAIEEPAKVAAS